MAPVPGVSVRLAADADLEALEALDPPGSGLSRARLTRQAAGGPLLLAAFDSSDCLGLCELVRGDTTELRNLHVAPEARGRGVGTALIRAAEELVGTGRMELAVGLENPRARALYLRLGYVSTGRLRTDSYDYVDASGTTQHAVETSEWLDKVLPG